MNKSNYLSNTVWLIMEKLIRLFSGLFIGVLVARFLGPSDYGVLNFAISFASLFGAIAAIGLDSVFVREFVDQKYSNEEIQGTGFFMKILATIVMWLAILATSLLLGYDTQSVYLIAVISIATIFQSINVIDFRLQAEVKSKFVAKLLMVQLLVSALVKLTLVIFDFDVISFAWVFTLESIIYFVGLIFLNYRLNQGSLFLWKWNAELSINLLKEGAPYILAGLAISAYLKLDIIMVKTLLGDESAGYYSAALRLSEAWYFIPMAIVSSFFPAIIKSRALGEVTYYRRISQLSAGLILIAFVISGVATLFADSIIYNLYGDEYSLSANVLVIHIWTTLFVFLGVISHRWYVIEKEKSMALKRSLIGLALNFSLNLILIPKLGIEGAAVATLISQVYISFLADYFDSKTKLLFEAKALFYKEVHHLFFLINNNLRNK